MLTTAIGPQQKTYVTAVKSISFGYAASQKLSELFEGFRSMCNDAIKVAIREKPKSRFNLIEQAYPRLKEYGLHTHYILAACEVAFAVYRNKKRASVPYVRRVFLKLDSQSYRLNHLLLRIPSTPRNFVFLALQGSDYHLSFLNDPGLKRGSVTITERTVTVAFSKEVPLLNPAGYLGIDLNERNVTVSSTDGNSQKFGELGEVVEIKERYRELRSKIGRMTRQDRRISGELYAKYGRRERNRTVQMIHTITKRLAEEAKVSRLGIKMEKLTGIRKVYRRGNGQGPSFRGRMNSWVFGEIQRQIAYKAMWAGVPVTFVNPRGTSRNCPTCGSHVATLQERKLYCVRCDLTWDRDVLASRNIMACAVPQARPLRGSLEGERGGDGSNPPSRCVEVKHVGDKKPTS